MMTREELAAALREPLPTRVIGDDVVVDEAAVNAERELAADYLDAPDHAGRVKVKAMVWVYDKFRQMATTRTLFGEWCAWEFEGGYGHYRAPGMSSGKPVSGGIKAAKAAAQADYESRILSALEPAPAPETAGVVLETKITPGPWVIDPCWDILGNTADGNGMVCQITTDAVPRDEARANASLIAAAPDLLEALRMCLLNGNLDCQERRLAEAALSKACGRARPSSDGDR